jgi:hypothetical protein
MMDVPTPPALVERADLQSGYLPKLEGLRSTASGAGREKDPWNEAVRDVVRTRAG